MMERLKIRELQLEVLKEMHAMRVIGDDDYARELKKLWQALLEANVEEK